MTCFMWSLSCHGHRWEHGMMCHDHGMSMYDMSCLNTGCLAMTVASCPCMTCHGICMKDVPCLCHHTCPRGHGGLLGGQVWGGFSIKKVVASILTNFFMRTIFGITYPHRKNGHAAETHQLFFFLIYSKYKYKYIYIPQSNFGVNGWTKLNF